MDTLIPPQRSKHAERCDKTNFRFHSTKLLECCERKFIYVLVFTQEFSLFSVFVFASRSLIGLEALIYITITWRKKFPVFFLAPHTSGTTRRKITQHSQRAKNAPKKRWRYYNSQRPKKKSLKKYIFTFNLKIRIFFRAVVSLMIIKLSEPPAVMRMRQCEFEDTLSVHEKFNFLPTFAICIGWPAQKKTFIVERKRR